MRQGGGSPIRTHAEGDVENRRRGHRVATDASTIPKLAEAGRPSARDGGVVWTRSARLTWLRRNLGSMPLVEVLRNFLGLEIPAYARERRGT